MTTWTDAESLNRNHEPPVSFRPKGEIFLRFLRINRMPVESRYYVYLMTNWNHRVMYVGVTNDLTRRVYEHKNKLIHKFTEKYNISKLVYFEETREVLSALTREKEIKKWRREKKNALVQSVNPEWRDLSEEGKDFSLRSK